MSKSKLALNIALMLEMVRAQGVSDEQLFAALQRGDTSYFESFGKGIPDWSTLLQFAREHPELMEQAISEGYQIVFLTFGALRSLLKFKFNLEPDVDYEVGEKELRNVALTPRQLEALQTVLAKNWTIVEEGYDPETQRHNIRIELVRASA